MRIEEEKKFLGEEIKLQKHAQKGFTIVELVIVIAVIAILAAVLIPTFSGVIEKANYSNDIQIAKNMSTQLAVENADFKTVNTIIDAKKSLEDTNYGNSFTPKTKGLHYYWCEVDNYVYLVNDSDSKFNVSFPETETNVKIENSYRLDKEYYSIEYELTNCSVDESESKKPVVIEKGQDSSKTITLIMQAGCSLDSVSVDCADFSYYYYDDTTIKLTFSNPTNNVTVKASASAYCLAKGTKITMANGSQENIENIVEGDEVLTFNHETGEYESQKVYLAWKCEVLKCAFTLHFTSDINISVIGNHCFFEKESLKYVTILESNAEEFIGKHFYNVAAGRYEELLSVTYETTPTEYYEIYTNYNANYIAENMLNVAYDTSEMLNLYSFYEDLTIDSEQLALDIAEFGIFEYREGAPYSKETYDSLSCKYINIMIGKGLLTWEDIYARAEVFFANYN